MIKGLATALALAIGLATMALAQQKAPTMGVAYFLLEGDPFYAHDRGYAGISRRERKPALAGAELALRDSSATARALGFELALVPFRLAAGDDAASRIPAALAESGAVAAILDLPIDDVRRASAAAAANSAALFNIRHRETALRTETCRTNLFHAIPSQAMLADALSQYLFYKNWRRILVLEGPDPTDRDVSRAFQASARRFQLRVVATKTFVLGHNPRRREEINVGLMTGDIDHDVVFVADASGDFGRYVPYRTMKPQLVVGDEGLMPGAWDVFWERHGAPQLSRRFERQVGRTMGEEDWAAWVAMRAVVQAAVQSHSRQAAGILAALKRPDLTLELYKGAPGSFRTWDRQLRQPILLRTRNAIVSLAPVEGFLHQRNNLDSLGVDESEFRCNP